MASRYVAFSISAFRAKMDAIGFTEVAAESLPGTFEYVFERAITNAADPQRYAVRIYSSVDRRSGESRPEGADAIRILLYDRVNAKILKVETRVHRTQNAFDNLHQRAREIYGYALKPENRCPQCASLMQPVTSKWGKTVRKFLGCSNYPNCRHTVSLSCKGS